MHLSEKQRLPVSGHKDIFFIDVDERNDTRLFIDPYVIQALPEDFCKRSSQAINSFFYEVFSACKTSNKQRLKEILAHASEPNETNLGMKTISDYGKGATAQSLSKLFLEFYKLVRKNPYITTNPVAMCMYIHRFDKDKMSDLITNIIRNLLYEFTVQQCKFWEMPLSEETKLIGYYWDCESLNWKQLYGHPFLVNGKSMLLVPKYLVRSRYVFNVECYIKQYTLKTLQDFHVKNNTDLCIIKENAHGKKVILPPTKDKLYKHELNGSNHKAYAFRYSARRKQEEEDFFKDIYKRISEGYGSLSDEELDRVVYGYRNKDIA